MRVQSLLAAAVSALLTPVFSAPTPLASKRAEANLNVLTYNLWESGTNVNNHHEKQVAFIRDSGADIVGLQEASDGDAVRLGQALNWYAWQSSRSVGILSRYPIVEQYGEFSRAGGVRLDVDGSQVNVWSAHLHSDPYGPYDFCFDKMTPEQVLAREEESGRVPQMKETLDGIKAQLDAADNAPVLLMGDFNAPSHLDWTQALREKNCGIADFQWPTSVLAKQAGLVDSFRRAHPDPVANQGTTWSPIFPRHDGNSGAPEPQDRIDFIYFKGPLTVVDSRTVVAGQPKASPGHADNQWTSDHAAVLTSYRI